MIGAVILQIFLIFLNSIFSSAEIAIVSLTEADIHKLEEDGDRRAKKLERITKQPTRFLVTIQAAVTIIRFLVSALAADAGSRLFYDGFWKNDSTEAGREKGRFHRSSYVRSSLSDFGHPHAAGLSSDDFQQSGAPSFRHRSL